jgi:uncharacterized Rmd1/YagE family protein
MKFHFFHRQKFNLNTLTDSLLKNTKFSKIVKTPRSIFVQFSKNTNFEKLPTFEEEKEELKYRKNLIHEEQIIHDEHDSFMTIFTYGSVAFVNVNEKEQKIWSDYLQNLSKPNNEKKKWNDSIQDDLTIIVNPDIKNWFKLTKDTLVVQKLNLNNLNIICSVIARSVALEHREHEVDKVLREFRALNEIILDNQGGISKA